MTLKSRGELAVFTDPAVHQIDAIKYFSAYAAGKPAQHERHQIYVKVLQSTGINRHPWPIQGKGHLLS
jgi:hypothetical protein